MRKLIIENFGPVPHAEIEIREFNLFIGQQSIGKSTIAKLITILTDRINLVRLIVGGNKAWKLLLEDYSLNSYINNDKYNIIYNFSESNYEGQIVIENNNITTTFREDGKEIKDTREMASTIILYKPLYNGEQVIKYLQKKTSNQEYDSDSTKMIELLKDSLYIPAERNIITSISKLLPAIMMANSVIERTILRFIVEFNNAKGEQSKWDIPLLDTTYVWENNEDYFTINKGKTKLPLLAASSGIKSLLPLYIVVNYALQKREFSSYVIEEPECNLFPDKQIDLLSYLIKNISGTKKTLTITTHSPYILSAINNYLFAGSIIKEAGTNAKEEIKELVGDIPILRREKCSIYSLGLDINDGQYCKDIITSDTSMIDTNSLDEISYKLGKEFDALDTYLMEKEDKND